MALHRFGYWSFILVLMIPFWTLAQIEEEESAEVFLEEYSDAFQEKFFEALKEKGIENTDRAINLLLECKQMESEYVVLDHELAKAYLSSGDLNSALEFALESVIAEPANYWYVNTLVKTLIRRNMKVDQLESDLPLENSDFVQNLTQSLYANKQYKEALRWVAELQASPANAHLRSKIEDSLAKAQERRPPAVETKTETEARQDPVSDYITQLTTLIGRSAVSEVLAMALEASERYPSQPYFYYAHGWALHQQGEHKRALRSLETGLDYLLDDENLANSFYKILASTHKALGNASKANMYLSKVKTGS